MCGRGLKSLAMALPLLSANKAVIYERQQWNMQFPQKCSLIFEVCDYKITKANLIFVEAAGYKLYYDKNGPHPLEKEKLTQWL